MNSYFPFNWFYNSRTLESGNIPFAISGLLLANYITAMLCHRTFEIFVCLHCNQR